MFAWFNKTGSEKMFKICSENFSGLPIHHGFYLLSVLNRSRSPHSQRTLPEAQTGESWLILTLSVLCYVHQLHYFI